MDGLMDEHEALERYSNFLALIYEQRDILKPSLPQLEMGDEKRGELYELSSTLEIRPPLHCPATAASLYAVPALLRVCYVRIRAGI